MTIRKKKKIEPHKAVSEKEAKESTEEKVFYEAKPMTPETGLSKKQIKINKKYKEKHEGEIVLIKMEMASGLFREFLAHDEGGFFYFRKKQYPFDPQMKYYIIERKMWAYDYHELISIPLQKKIELSDSLIKLIQPVWDDARKKAINPRVDASQIQTLIENSDIVDVEASLNPLTLKRFTDSEVIKQVLQGTMLGKIFKIMFVLIIILAVMGLIQVMLSLYASGVFSALGSFFKGGG